MLTKNESQMDRAIRLIVGLVLLVVGSFVSGWPQIVLYILAIAALVTAATGFCWLYKLLNFSSLKEAADVSVTADAADAEKIEKADAVANNNEEVNLMIEEEPEVAEAATAEAGEADNSATEAISTEGTAEAAPIETKPTEETKA